MRELRGLYTPGPRPTIMSSWSVGLNPYTSVAVGSGTVKSLGALGAANGEGGSLPSWLGWGFRRAPVKAVWCNGRPAKPVKYFYSRRM